MDYIHKNALFNNDLYCYIDHDLGNMCNLNLRSSVCWHLTDIYVKIVLILLKWTRFNFLINVLLFLPFYSNPVFL